MKKKISNKCSHTNYQKNNKRINVFFFFLYKIESKYLEKKKQYSIKKTSTKKEYKRKLFNHAVKKKMVKFNHNEKRFLHLKTR